MSDSSMPRPQQETKSQSREPDPFDRLPKFDPSVFEPPIWARKHMVNGGRDDSFGIKNGESSRSTLNALHFSDSSRLPEGQTSRAENGVKRDNGSMLPDGALFDDDEDDAENEDVWEDAMEDLGVDPETEQFRLEELKRLLAKAQDLKAQGNAHFTARPARHPSAADAYQNALKCLPIIPVATDGAAPVGSAPQKEGATEASASSGHAPPPSSHAGPSRPRASRPNGPTSQIEEITEEEASAIQADLSRAAELAEEGVVSSTKVKTEAEERTEVETEITETRKACYGNLGACYLAMDGKEKECVDACTEALKIDPKYTKALQRRALASERLSTWTSLTTARDDYTLLLTLLPPTHPSAVSARKALVTLPSRIAQQQEKEKDEMMGKLKELGNGILGRFGLSTDNFKFDPQEGGGYSMRFER